MKSWKDCLLAYRLLLCYRRLTRLVWDYIRKRVVKPGKAVQERLRDHSVLRDWVRDESTFAVRGKNFPAINWLCALALSLVVAGDVCLFTSVVGSFALGPCITGYSSAVVLFSSQVVGVTKLGKTKMGNCFPNKGTVVDILFTLKLTHLSMTAAHGT